ncbi:P-II family nitrogen regulator [Deferrisoma camini]|uniref:P-II family nitrogen regulator n=1 Tax=Deferrisoma camini TaxID=1035120 RepID=UPI00046D8503|nr:P-II family nitrogen regulator [Deferrisoma camini]
MKMIQAIVNTDRLDELRDRLFEIGAPGLTVDSVMGIGKPLGQMRYSDSRGFVPKFFAKSRVQIVAEDDRVDEIVEAVRTVCHTGQIGDGKIFVLPVDEVVRIRTNERGSRALY